MVEGGNKRAFLATMSIMEPESALGKKLKYLKFSLNFPDAQLANINILRNDR